MSYKKIIVLIVLLLIGALLLNTYRTEILQQIDRWGLKFSQNGNDIGDKKDHEPGHVSHESHDHSNHEHQINHAHEHQEENIIKLTENQIRQLGLQFQVAGPGNLFLTISTPAKITLKPNHVAHITLKISGIVRDADKNIGDFVKQGEVLAVLESHDIAEMKAAYLAALSKERLIDSVLKREEGLYQDKVSPLQDYLNARNSYEEASINVQMIKQKLRASGLTNEQIHQLAYENDPDLISYQIRAPLTGTVIMRHINNGEFIEKNTSIYEIADLDTVWVEVGIYPKDLNRVKVGQMIEVLLPGENQSSQARLIYVSPIVEGETITAKAIAELDNPEDIWRPGTFVTVIIMTEKINVPLVVTKGAVQSSEGKDFVFVVTLEGFEKRFVKLGKSDQKGVEVLSGLNLGDEYVANKTFLLKAELGKSAAEHQH